jgi:hypothetical protein
MKNCPHGMPTPGSCLDCMDEGNLPPAAKSEPESIEAVFDAQFDSQCPSCDLPIRVGSRIAKTSRDRYLHLRCASDPRTTVRTNSNRRSNDMSNDYEELTGTGSFVKWTEVGQSVEGVIVSFTTDGGQDFDGKPCPELTLDTAEGLQTVTCAQANIKSKVLGNAAKLVPGARCRVTYSGTYESKNGTPGKEFRVAVAPPALVDVDSI